MKRRDFILLKPGRSNRCLELSCERLYMRYHDSYLDDTTQELFKRLEAELHDVDELRLLDSAWLSGKNLRQQLDPLLVSLRARGGRVEFLPAPVPHNFAGSN